MADDASAPATAPAAPTADQIAAAQAVLAQAAAQQAAAAAAAKAATYAVLQPFAAIVGGDAWTTITSALAQMRSAFTDPDLNVHFAGAADCLARGRIAFDAALAANAPTS